MKSYNPILKLANRFEKLAQGDFCFFVDMDETLLFAFDVGMSKAKQMQSANVHRDDFKIVQWGQSDVPNVYASIKRPYADEFLTALNSMGRVTLATASPPPYAHAILEAHNLKRYFDKIYTGSDLNGVPKERCDQFFLIDNSHINSPVIEQKMQMLGVESELPEEAIVYEWSEEEKKSFYEKANKRMTQSFISVSDFNGAQDDNGLIIALQNIKERLSSIS